LKCEERRKGTMKGRMILGTALAVAVMVFVIAPIASAQQYAGILDDQWFQVKLSAKGYMIDDDQDQTVLGKGQGGSASAYLLFCFDGSSSYTITTCTEDDRIPDQWYIINNVSAQPQPPIPNLPSPRNSISTDNIYGAAYPQIWDFDERTPLVLYDGISILSLHPVFYTKITADITNPAAVKTASIVHVSCGLHTKEDMGLSAQYGIGSCTMSGFLIPVANVTKKVPQSCQSVCPPPP
jgi:hypothetical protein